MSLRARVKKVFGRTGSISDGSSLKLKKTNTSNSSSNLAPDPKPKYRGPVDPKHKERLEAFSFVSSPWRRRSHQSECSPFGSRQPSRNNSLGGADPKKLFGRGPSHVGKMMHNVDDSGDLGNVSESRNHSGSGSPSTAPTDSTADIREHGDTQAGAQEGSTGYAHDHTIFTEADVNEALAKVASKRSAS